MAVNGVWGEPTFTDMACVPASRRLQRVISLVLKYLCSRLNVLNLVPVSWAGGVGDYGVSAGFCGGAGGRTQPTDRRKEGVQLVRQLSTPAGYHNHQGSILRNSQALPNCGISLRVVPSLCIFRMP